MGDPTRHGAEARLDADAAQQAQQAQSVTVRYFAGARAAAGRTVEAVPAGLDRAGLVAELTGRHGDRLGRVLAAASFLVDGIVWHDRHTLLPAGATVDVLPPFAGG